MHHSRHVRLVVVFWTVAYLAVAQIVGSLLVMADVLSLVAAVDVLPMAAPETDL